MNNQSRSSSMDKKSYQHNNHRLKKIQPFLACPECKGDLSFREKKYHCSNCQQTYPVKNGKVYFIEPPEIIDDLDTIKGWLKKHLGKYYYIIGVHFFAPTFPFNYVKKIRKHFDLSEKLVIDTGSGNNRIDRNIICLDLFDYKEVDIVCDMEKLPFKSESIDGFVSRSVLEHVQNPFKIVKEFFRCTRIDGLGIHLIPFLYPFHASPYDFVRFTHHGREVLFENWKIVEQYNTTGPITLALLCMIEFLSIILSLGNEKIKACVNLVLCVLLFPFKYFDAPFINKKQFLTMSPSILTMVSKK